MLIPPDKRVSERAGVTNFRTANYYASAVSAGPSGSTTMTFACVFSGLRVIPNGQEWLFSKIRSDFSSGWGMYYIDASTDLRVSVANGAGAQALLLVPLPRAIRGETVLLVATLAGGTLTARASLAAADVSTAVVGYTPSLVGGTATIVGVNAAGAGPAAAIAIHDCAMFNTYAGTGFVSATFGNGLAGLIAMWQEDLQQGRYLTKPQGGALTANDAYWSARDVVQGPATTKLTWTDRSPNAAVVTRVGAPQGASVGMRF